MQTHSNKGSKKMAPTPEKKKESRLPIQDVKPPAPPPPPTEKQIAERAAAGFAPDGNTPLHTSAAKEGGPKFEVVVTPHGEFRKGTIVHDIYEILTRPAATAPTFDAMVEELVAKHPATGEKNFRQRIQWHISQAPIKYGKAIGRDKSGRISMNIEGWDATKVLTPEMEAKRQELLAKKAAKMEEKKKKAEAEAGAVEAKAAAKAAKEKEKLEKAQAKAAEAQKKAEEKAKAAQEKAAKVLADAQQKAKEAQEKAAKLSPIPGAVVSVGKAVPSVKG